MNLLLRIDGRHLTFYSILSKTTFSLRWGKPVQRHQGQWDIMRDSKGLSTQCPCLKTCPGTLPYRPTHLTKWAGLHYYWDPFMVWEPNRNTPRKTLVVPFYLFPILIGFILRNTIDKQKVFFWCKWKFLSHSSSQITLRCLILIINAGLVAQASY